VLATFVIVFAASTLSTTIANIPPAASMLPVVEFLTGSIPGLSSKVLYYALSGGAAMGGNGLLIGGEANLVMAGITDMPVPPFPFWIC
jgi:Na+/H+ antiporter NhaD/arsenite permease-like protein